METSDYPPIARFQTAWQEMTESMEECVAEGISPKDVLESVGVEVPAFVAPLLADMFTGSNPATAPEG